MDTFMKVIREMRHHQMMFFKLSKYDPERSKHLKEAKRLETVVDTIIETADATGPKKPTPASKAE